MSKQTKRALTDADIESMVTHTQYQRLSPRMTACLLTLANGYEVLGTSSCVDPANYDQAKGEKHARENALSKVWELEGYRLREALYAAQPTPPAVATSARLEDLPFMLRDTAQRIENGAETAEFIYLVMMHPATNPVVCGFGGPKEHKEIVSDLKAALWVFEPPARAEVPGWLDAPSRITLGADMVIADFAVGKDETLTCYTSKEGAALIDTIDVQLKG